MLVVVEHSLDSADLGSCTVRSVDLSSTIDGHSNLDGIVEPIIVLLVHFRLLRLP